MACDRNDERNFDIVVDAAPEMQRPLQWVRETGPLLPRAAVTAQYAMHNVPMRKIAENNNVAAQLLGPVVAIVHMVHGVAVISSARYAATDK